MTTGGGLSASSVSKSFYGNRVLHQFDLQIAKGKLHALLGHNGSGKSTFIKILAGYYTPDADSGHISVDGHELVPGDPDSSRDAGSVATYAASAPSRNITLQAIADAGLAEAEKRPVVGQVPFSSRRRWSALDLGDERLVVCRHDRKLEAHAFRIIEPQPAVLSLEARHTFGTEPLLPELERLGRADPPCDAVHHPGAGPSRR